MIKTFMVYWCVPCQRFGIRPVCQFCDGKTDEVGLYEDHMEGGRYTDE